MNVLGTVPMKRSGLESRPESILGISVNVVRGIEPELESILQSLPKRTGTGVESLQGELKEEILVTERGSINHGQKVF